MPDILRMSRGTSPVHSLTPPRDRPEPDVDTLVSEGGVEVEFHDEQGAYFRLVVLGNTLLMDVQKILVQWLGLPFPQPLRDAN